jgi:hypothetical protein
MHVCSAYAGGAQRLQCRFILRTPELFRIVFDPPRARKMLRELSLGRAKDASIAIEYKRARARRALIQSENDGYFGWPSAGSVISIWLVMNVPPMCVGLADGAIVSNDMDACS